MGRKLADELEIFRRDFLEGADKRKIPVELAKRIFSQLELFASNAFNQAHTTAYAMLTYQSACLKAHYPDEYMAMDNWV